MTSKPNSQPEQPKRKRGRPPNPDENKIVEQIRGLMRLNFSDPDIKRMVVASNENRLTKTGSVNRYLRLARVRNQQILGRNEEECRADSMGYWSRKQQEAENTITAARRDMEYARGKIRSADEILEDPTAQVEHKEAAAARKKEALSLLDHARRQIFSASNESKECQDRIDRLLGNHAPVKIAQTTKEGKDVAKAVEEPTTAEKADEEIEGLYAALLERQGAPDAGLNGHRKPPLNGKHEAN